MIRLRRIACAAAAAALSLTALTAPASQAQAITYNQIVNNGSGLCLDMPNIAIGTVAIQYPCSSGNSFEFWALVPVCTHFGCNNQFLIKNLNTSLCLAPSTTSVPTTVVQNVCNTTGGNLGQVWKKIPSSGSIFELGNDLDGADMHPESNSNAIGTPIYVNFATSNSHYLWHLGA
jgi:hypothetical protein